MFKQLVLFMTLIVLGLAVSSASALPTEHRVIHIRGLQPLVTPATSDQYPEIRKRVAYMLSKYKPRTRLGVDELAYWVDVASQTYDVPYELLLSKAAVESSFNPRAVSKRGAYGLMQVKPGIHGNTRRELLDYRVSLMSGAQVIASYKAQCRGNLRCAVESYNVGITAYHKGVRNSSYVARIERHLRSMGASLHRNKFNA